MPNWFNRTLTMPKVKHSTFDMSNNYKTSTKIGRLTPVYCEECLPSDTFKYLKTDAFVRLSPLLYPLMHYIKIHTSRFFIPFRIILGENNYEDFLNGQKDIVPVIFSLNESSTNTNPYINSILDYLGYDIIHCANRVQSPGTSSYYWNLTLQNPLMYFSYLAILRDWYMDSNLEESYMNQIDELFKNYQQAVKNGLSSYAINLSAPGSDLFQNCFTVSYLKDYFTTARPQPQMGSEMYVLNRPLSITWTNPEMANSDVQNSLFGPYNVSGLVEGEGLDSEGTSIYSYANEDTTIRDLWRKEMIQQYYQIDNKFGSRIREKLAGHFGVLYSDKRIQIPQYLGGSASSVKISEVVQTSESSENSALGFFAGKGGDFSSSVMRKFYCEEHGYFITLLSLIPLNGYCNGSDRTFYKTNILDFASPEFNNIGWQEIYKGEVFGSNSISTDKEAWAYQPRYSEYRSHPSRCTGDFRTTEFLGWHLNRNFSTIPPLNSSFLRVADTDRIFNYANPEDSFSPVYVDVQNTCSMSRPISYEPDSMHIY